MHLLRADAARCCRLPQCLLVASSSLILVFWVQLSSRTLHATSTAANGRRALGLILFALFGLLLVLVITASFENATAFPFVLAVGFAISGISLLWSGHRAYRAISHDGLSHSLRTRLVRFPLVCGVFCICGAVLTTQHASRIDDPVRSKIIISTVCVSALRSRSFDSTVFLQGPSPDDHLERFHLSDFLAHPNTQ